MKRGSSLFEMLIAVAILSPLLALSASLDYTALRELPRAAALTQTSVQVQNMLHALRQDVESADSLRLNGEVVELQGKAGWTTYSRKGNQFSRTFQPRQGKPDVRAWALADADIQWKTWDAKGRNYAMEVRTAMIAQEHGQSRRKLANSQVFFLRTDAAPEEAK